MSVPVDVRDDEHADVVVVGAGMSGLRTALLLAEAGLHVIVLDKGRRHGGRMATRRVDDATFDTGAIAFTGSSPTFRAALAGWEAVGHVARTGEWDREAPDGWRGSPMMRSLPAALAAKVESEPHRAEVRLATAVTGLDCTYDDTTSWQVTALHADTTYTVRCSSLVLTMPAPQALSLLTPGPAAGTALASTATLELLRAVRYAPSLTVLARPIDRTSSGISPATAIPSGPGTAAPDLARIHRNETTGASNVVALTLQASEDFSAAHLDGDRVAAADHLAAQASTVVGVPLEVVHVHGWRYAQATNGIVRSGHGTDELALIDCTSGAPLALAGDHFFGRAPDGTESDLVSPLGVERAFLSGGAAAGLLLAALRDHQ